MSNELEYETLDILSEDEMLILNIVQEYLNLNRTFNRLEIIPYINSMISKSQKDISYDGINKILKSLVEKNIIVEGKKFTKVNIFKNHNRNRIFEHIRNNPGIHFNKLVNELNISVFSVEWHLNVLVKFNLIRKKKFEKFDAYFVYQFPSENDEIYHYISREKCKNIIQFLEINNEGYSKNYITNKLNIHANTVKKYIKILERYGLLTKKSFSNMSLYFLNKDAYQKLFYF